MARFAVDTKLAILAVLTRPARVGMLERYPAVPRPITVEPSCVWRYEVETRVAKLAVDTKLARFAVETKLARFAIICDDR